MDYIYSDPRPEIIQDSNLWKKLLRLIPTLEDKDIAGILQKRLWTLRSAGTMLKPTSDGGLKFVPIIRQGSDWENEDFFKEMAKKHLKPYAKEINYLLGKVMNHDNTTAE
jgi:hypothetical protein